MIQVGDKFGELTVMSQSPKPEDKTLRGSYYSCVCSCGNIKVIHNRSLKDGDAKSCGCLRKRLKEKTNQEKAKQLEERIETQTRSGELLAKNDPLILKIIEDPNYEITPEGLIFTNIARTGKKFVDEDKMRLAGYENSQGYWHIQYLGKRLLRSRIIYAKFLAGKNGNPELSRDLVINHKSESGNRSDDRPENLELVSQKANNLHRFSILKREPVYGNCKLSFEIADQIRKEKLSGATHSQLVAKYGISKGHVSQIVNNKIWFKESP